MTSLVVPPASAARAAVSVLEAGMNAEAVDAYSRGFNPRDAALWKASPDARRAAWAILGIWLAYRSCGQASDSFTDAEEWFWAGNADARVRITPRVDPAALDEALRLGENIADSALPTLVPYILDDIDLGTRRQVIRDPALGVARSHRKSLGSYYTPGDVAAFMARSVMHSDVSTYLDPACGTGVFLIALLEQLIADGSSPIAAVGQLYGVDINPTALEGTCFAVLSRLASCDHLPQPWRLWHLMRLNLAEADALEALSDAPADPLQRARDRQLLRHALETEDLPTQDPRSTTSTSLLFSLFPETDGGFGGVLGNPPYAPMSAATVKRIAGAFGSLAVGDRGANTYVPFTEYMWRATSSSGRAAMVVPMSIAYSSDAPIQRLRNEIARTGIKWRFRFYDRTPDSIFGDDVKQRVAIGTCEKAVGSAGRVETSRIHRWTSTQRADLFANGPRLVEIQADGLTDGIPKISEDWEVVLLRAIRRAASIRVPGEWRLDSGGSPNDTLAVGLTAYNWLVVYRDRLRPDLVDHFPIPTPTPVAADWGYAVLRSRVVYWLWRVFGDGFHVTRRFVNSLPFAWRSDHESATLADLGKALWEFSSSRPVRSVNAKKATVSYLLAEPRLLDQIDAAVLAGCQLAGRAPLAELRTYVDTNIAVGRSNSRGTRIGN